MVFFVIAVLVLLAAVYVISSYNGFIKLRNKSEEAFSAMDVILKKRYDLIPNVVETVKGYAKHEKETFENVIKARNNAVNSITPEEVIKNDNVLTGTLRNLFALSENYPDLKANTNFLELQKQLSKIEDEISASRRYYNGVVNTFNTKLEVFPSNIIAGIFHFVRKPLYVVNDDKERENVKVSF
ncbi:LemA family protein [uncultured Clostridium sp.]|uniref:LemA family protein n=1 Tax=uncultured Clostridium sp. TaxID=59620 RepID=UPI0025F3C468|nr:LemA family protein [uncultured Clostridium sp.]